MAESPILLSVTVPVKVPEMTDASSVPVMLTVTCWMEPSDAVNVMVSLTPSPASRS